MDNSPRHPDSKVNTGDENGAVPERGSTTGTPRWVKVFGLIAIVIAGMNLFLHDAGGHGPGRHMSGGPAPETPSSVTAFSGAGGHRPIAAGRTL